MSVLIINDNVPVENIIVQHFQSFANTMELVFTLNNLAYYYTFNDIYLYIL